MFYQCRYTWFSASDACKAEQHPIKVFTGLKRFFECSGCTNRTVAVTFLPLLPCSKCGETKWKRAAMMKVYKYMYIFKKLYRNGIWERVLPRGWLSESASFLFTDISLESPGWLMGA